MITRIIFALSLSCTHLTLLLQCSSYGVSMECIRLHSNHLNLCKALCMILSIKFPFVGELTGEILTAAFFLRLPKLCHIFRNWG